MISLLNNSIERRRKMERKFSEIPRECEEITIDTDNITNYRKFTKISYYFSIYILLVQTIDYLHKFI